MIYFRGIDMWNKVKNWFKSTTKEEVVIEKHPNEDSLVRIWELSCFLSERFIERPNIINIDYKNHTLQIKKSTTHYLGSGFNIYLYINGNQNHIAQANWVTNHPGYWGCKVTDFTPMEPIFEYIIKELERRASLAADVEAFQKAQHEEKQLEQKRKRDTVLQSIVEEVGDNQ